jgi:hypothetical protein
MKLQSILFVKLAGVSRLAFYFRLSNGNIWTIQIGEVIE